MASVVGGLFSLAAHGNFGEILVYQRRRGKASCFPYKVPRYRAVEVQVSRRASFASAVSSWKALPGASKAYYNERAMGLRISGYIFYIQAYLLDNL